MGMIQIRFEDPSSSVTVYGLWDDDEVPSIVTILASLQDAFRAREGAPLVHAAWHRALGTCRAVEAELSDHSLDERHAAARERFLAGGSVAADAASVAALLLAYDAHCYRPYPDGGPTPDDDHGIGGKPHLTVTVAREDHGHGPETVLTLRVAEDEWICEMFNRPLDPDDELDGKWYGQADLSLARRIRSVQPFGNGLTRVEQAAESTPVVVTRLDAVTVAVAHARILSMPLPVSLELHGSLHPTPPSSDLPALSRGEGWLMVRFHRDAFPEHGLPETTVSLRRRGDAGDIPDVLARIAALPLLPVALEATRDRVKGPFIHGESFAAKHERPGESEIRAIASDPDVAVRMRSVERHLYPHGGLNMRGAVQGYASLLFTAEPGLWEMLPDGSASATDPDVTVEITRVLPPDMVGGFVVHGSGDPPPTADSPLSNVSNHFRIAPAERHVAALAADPILRGHGHVLSAWGDDLAPLKVTWIGFDPVTCGLTVNFEEACLAGCYARFAGIDLPGATPFGDLPRIGPYRWRGLIPHVPDWEPEALLGPAELGLQRRAQAELAEREAART